MFNQFRSLKWTMSTAVETNGLVNESTNNLESCVATFGVVAFTLMLSPYFQNLNRTPFPLKKAQEAETSTPWQLLHTHVARFDARNSELSKLFHYRFAVEVQN